MLALMFGNPGRAKKTGGKKMKMAKKKSKKGRNPSKGKKKGKKHNPFKFSTKGAMGSVKEALGLAVGAVVVKAVKNNLPIPADWQGGVLEAVSGGVLSLGLGYALKRVKLTAPYAARVSQGGLAITIFEAIAPSLLPSLSFTAAAKAKAMAHGNASALLAATNKQIATVNAGQPGDAGAGDAFIMSRGGISTRDRSPRDTAPLAGVGDAYAIERPGFSGAPNGLTAPWSTSIYRR